MIYLENELRGKRLRKIRQDNGMELFEMADI